MTDYIVSERGSSLYQTTEHYHKCVLAGEPESVRLRLVDALERLGYDILDDEVNVIRGRRGPKGWAAAYASADVLDYPRTLIVKLKPNGPRTTRATFDYVIKHPSLSRGEVDILTREAEALSSMAIVRSVEKMCAACGTDATDDSRFCRQCGSPMTVQNSDLELLQMAAEIRAGYTSVVSTTLVLTASTILIGAALLAMLLTGVVFGKGLGTLLVIGLAASLINIFFSAFGWNRISRALKVKRIETNALTGQRTYESSPANLSFTAAPQLRPSVTEGTTNLLNREKTSFTTGSFETDGILGHNSRDDN